MHSDIWNRLKDWIGAGTTRRPRRRSLSAGFRGQFESLEARSMLSASYGGEVAHVELHVVAVVVEIAPRAPLAAVYAGAEFHPIDSALRETRPANPLNGRRHEPVAFTHRAEPGVYLPREVLEALSDLMAQSQVKPLLSAQTGGNGQAANPAISHSGIPLGALGGTASETDVSSGSLSITGVSNLQSGGNVRFRTDVFSDRPPSVMSATLVNYLSTLPTTLSTTALPRHPSTPSFAKLDGAFGSYSDDSLLLTTNVDAKHRSELDDELDLDVTDKQESDDALDADHLPVAEQLTESLDALQRERVAIDAVLADLHEVKLPLQNSTRDTTEVRDDRAWQKFHESDARCLPPDTTVATQVAGYQTTGGMVLLAPSGNANHSAFDRVVFYIAGGNESIVAPRGAEASLGMYQAMDVGVRESQPMSHANPAIAQPTATARPSVSAENVPAKKSDQPS